MPAGFASLVLILLAPHALGDAGRHLQSTYGDADGTCDASVRHRNPDARCDTDGEYYWCDCRHCNLTRACASDSSLSTCACPSGTVGTSGSLWIEFPLSPRWWTRFGFLDFVCGFFGSVLVFFTWSVFLLHAVIIWDQSCSVNTLKMPSPMGGCPIGLACLCSLAAGIWALFFASCSGPCGLGIAILLPALCVLRLFCEEQSRRNIRASPPRHLRRELSDPRALVRGVRAPPVTAHGAAAAMPASEAPVPVVVGTVVAGQAAAGDAVASAVDAKTLSERLKELEEAHRSGLLSQKEHDAARQRVLQAV